MKAMRLPRQQEGAVMMGLDEVRLGERIVIFAHRLPRDDASCKNDVWIAFVGGSCEIQKGVFSGARGPYDKHQPTFEV